MKYAKNLIFQILFRLFLKNLICRSNTCNTLPELKNNKFGTSTRPFGQLGQMTTWTVYKKDNLDNL